MVLSQTYTKPNTRISTKGYKTLLDEVSLYCFAIYNIFGTLINSYYARIESVRLFIDVVRFAIFFLFALNILDNMLRKRIKPTGAFYVFALCSALIFLLTRRYNFIFMTIFACWAVNFDFKRILKTGIRFKLIGIGIVIISALCGIIQNDIVTRIGNDVLRYSLGFTAPSLCLAYILNIVIAEIIVADFNLKWSKLIGYSVLVYIIYEITNARLDAGICFFILFAAFIGKLIRGNSKKFFKNRLIIFFAVAAPLIAFLLNGLLVYGFNSGGELFIKIASTLSNRIEYTLEAYNLVGIKPFGTDIVWQDYDIILDSSYFKLLLEYGVVGLALILYGYFAVIKRTIKGKNFALLFALIIVLGESVFEPFIFDYNYNFFIFVVGPVLVKNLKGQKGGYEY